MATESSQDLARFVRERHVHYEVEPETVDEDGRRAVVAHDVQLFAAHGEEGLHAPGCPRCAELTRELQGLAEQLVRAGAEDRTELLLEASPALHQSAEGPDTDEVSLTVRVRCGSSEHQAASGTDPCLTEVEDRLREAGVPRQ